MLRWKVKTARLGFGSPESGDTAFHLDSMNDVPAVHRTWLPRCRGCTVSFLISLYTVIQTNTYQLPKVTWVSQSLSTCKRLPCPLRMAGVGEKVREGKGTSHWPMRKKGLGEWPAPAQGFGLHSKTVHTPASGDSQYKKINSLIHFLSSW